MSAEGGWARRTGGSPFARVAVDVGSTFAEEVARLRLEAMTSWLRQHPHLTWTAGELADLAAEVGDEEAVRRALAEPDLAGRRAERELASGGAGAVESEVLGRIPPEAPGPATRPKPATISRRVPPRASVVASRVEKSMS